MKLACWMIIRNDEYYVDMAIKSIINYVDGIYILDNGSEDNTIKVIESFKSDKIYLDKIQYNFEKPDFDKGDHTWTHPYWWWDEKYNGNSLEAQTRNICMNNCIKKFNPDWLIQIDADEIYTPLFFEKLNKYKMKDIDGIKCSANQFISPNNIISNYNSLFDVHIRSWNPNIIVKWKKLDKKMGHVAPVFSVKERNIILIEDIVHIHLHRTFGPKSEIFWRVKKEEEIPYDPRINKERFREIMKMAKKIDFDWKGLEFVIDKWKEWGIWW